MVEILAKTLKLNRAVADRFYPLDRELYNLTNHIGLDFGGIYSCEQLQT